jgi:hypothetical protein
MNFTTKMILALVAVVATVLIAAYIIQHQAPKNYDEFAQCLTSKGMKLYGAFWCSVCQKQKSLFGSSAVYINHAECSTPDGKSQTAECQAAGIESYPTWQLPDGSKRAGILTFQELAAFSGCKLPV